MQTSSIGAVIQHLRQTMRFEDEVGLTDAQLLERFIAHRDEAAFAALVRRHGSMVMGVCLREKQKVSGPSQNLILTSQCSPVTWVE
jgi:hypothetical protein